MQLPLSAAMAASMKAKAEAEADEKAQIKKLVLQANKRDEQEELRSSPLPKNNTRFYVQPTAAPQLQVNAPAKWLMTICFVWTAFASTALSWWQRGGLSCWWWGGYTFLLFLMCCMPRVGEF